MNGELALWIIGGLVTALAALVQWWMKRIERDIAEGRKATEAKLEAVRKDAKEQVDGIGQRLYNHELMVARDYVSYPRLMEALKPFSERLETMAEVQQRIFERLDGKADKAGHD